MENLLKNDIMQETMILDNYLCGSSESSTSYSDAKAVISRVKEVSNILLFAYENDIDKFADLKQHFSPIRLNLYKSTVFFDKEFVRNIGGEEKVVLTKNDYAKIKFVNQKITQLEEQFSKLITGNQQQNFEYKEVTDSLSNITYGLFGNGIFRVSSTEPLPSNKVRILSSIDGENLTTLHTLRLDCDFDVDIFLQNGIEKIDSEIFTLCKGVGHIKSIYIPKTISKISVGCFSGASIDNIVIEKDNQTYHSKGNCIIETATNTLIAVGSNFTIPDYVNKIAEKAFAYDDKLCDLNLPSSINIIGDEAFSGCSKLRVLNIPSDCKIGTKAFKGCHNLLIKYILD